MLCDGYEPKTHLIVLNVKDLNKSLIELFCDVWVYIAAMRYFTKCMALKTHKMVILHVMLRARKNAFFQML